MGVGGCKFKQHVARGRVDGKPADTGDGGEGESRERGGWGERETERERRVGRERDRKRKEGGERESCLEGKGQGIRGKL